MALPGGVDTVVVTGTFLDPAGVPQRGSVSLTPSVFLTDTTDSVVIAPVARTWELSGGTFTSGELASTDSAALSPAGWWYTIAVSVQNSPPYAFDAFIPASGTPVDISTLAPLESVPAMAAFLPLAGGQMTGPLYASESPVLPAEVATKAYVDATATGLAAKQPVQEATTAALPANTYLSGVLTANFTGALTVDGVAVAQGDRVLVKNEAVPADNGIYTATDPGSSLAPYILTRSPDMTTAAQFPGAYAYAEQGAVNGGSGWIVASEGPFTVGATPVTWTQMTGLGEVTAGTGLTAAGNTLSLATPVTIGHGGTGSSTQNFTGLLTKTAVKTSGYTAAPGDYVACDTTSGAFTVTLPTAPAANTVIGAKLIASAVPAAAVTVACGSGDAFNKTSGATTYTLSLLMQGATFQYSTGIWLIQNDDLPLDKLDQRYLPVVNIATYGALTSASDNGPAINAAIAALPSGGGIVYIPGGGSAYTYSTQINLAGKSSVTLMGVTVPTAGAGMPSVLTWTGTGSGSAINCQNSNGVAIKNLCLLYSSSSFTGILTDWRNVSGSDTSYGLLENCYLGGASAITTAQSLVNLDKCINMTVRKCNFAGSTYGIYGRSSSGHYSNVIQIDSCVFHFSATAHIYNPHQAWRIDGCTFEALSGGTNGAMAHDSGVNADGMLITGCWTGDGTGGTQFTVAGQAISFIGNWIGCTSGTCIYTDDVVTGLSIIGNDYVSASVALKTVQPSGSSSATSWVIFGNTYTSVTTKLSGNFAAGAFYHDGAAQSSSTGLSVYGINVNGALSLIDGSNIGTGISSGTRIGTTASQKLGFWNTAPVAQPAVTGTDAASALSSLLAALGTGAGGMGLVSSTAAGIVNPLATTAVYYVTTSGSDSSNGQSWGAAFATIQHAVSALPGGGGRIYAGSGTFTTSSQISLNGLTNVIIEGVGGRTGGGVAGTTITYSGTASAFVTAQSSVGCQLLNLQLVYSSTSFTGNLVDARNVTTSDTAFFRVANCLLAGSGISTATALIALDKCNTSEIVNCALVNAAYGVTGMASGNYSNSNRIAGNQFSSLGTCAILGSGQDWVIEANTFEALAGGSAGAYTYGAGQGGNAVTFSGNWFGDVSNGGTWITWAGNSLVVRGNYIAGDSSTTGVAVTSSSCFGIEVASNDFVLLAKAVDLGSTTGHTNFAVMFNNYTSVTTPVNATTWPTGGIHYTVSSMRVGNFALTGEASGSGHGVFLDAETSGDTAASVRGGQGFYITGSGTEKLRLDASVTLQHAATAVTTTSALAANIPGVVLAKNAITITLPTPSSGFRSFIKNTDSSNTVTLTASSGTIDGASSISLPPLRGVEIAGDGANWWVLANDLALDATAADIADNGARAAGSTGQSADAGHVHALSVAECPADRNLLAWTFPPSQVITEQISTSNLPSGDLALTKIWLRKPVTVTNIVLAIGNGAGATLTAQECFTGLYNSSGTLVASTGDCSGAVYTVSTTATSATVTGTGFASAMIGTQYTIAGVTGTFTVSAVGSSSSLTMSTTVPTMVSSAAMTPTSAFDWTAAGNKNAGLVTPVITPYSAAAGFYWIGYLCNGTTGPVLCFADGGNTALVNFGLTSSTLYAGFISGKSSLPSSFTPSSAMGSGHSGSFAFLAALS